MKPTKQTPELQAEAERVIQERADDLERARRWMRTRMTGEVEGFIDGPLQVDTMLAAYAREQVNAALGGSPVSDLKGKVVTLADVEKELGPQSTWGEAAKRIAIRNKTPRVHRTIEEREIKPEVPTTLTVEVLEADNATVKTTFELQLHSVRDGFAFPVEDGEDYNGPFCLDGGWHNCYHDGGVRLAQASLQFCLDLAGKKPV